MTAMLSSLGRVLLLIGAVTAVAGGALMLIGDRLAGRGRLPGDIVIQRPGYTFYFPLGLCIAASLLLTFLLWLVRLARR